MRPALCVFATNEKWKIAINPKHTERYINNSEDRVGEVVVDNHDDKQIDRTTDQ